MPKSIVPFLILVAVIVSVPVVLSYGPSSRSIFGGQGPSALQSNGSGIYNSLHVLKGNSTIIVFGTYTSVNSTYNTSIKTITDFSISVSQYLKGAGPNNIYVVGTPTVSAPLPTVGQKFVLFLTSWISCPPPTSGSPCYDPPTPTSQTYIPTGGAQGMFLVQNGAVSGYKTLYPSVDSWIQVDANAVPLGQFISMVNSS